MLTAVMGATVLKTRTSLFCQTCVLSFLMALSSAIALSAPSQRADSKMVETYNRLAQRAVQSFQERGEEGDAFWIGLAGGPGSGKSTLAEGVVTAIQKRGIDAIVVPMDGYHFSKASMGDRKLSMTRRGAPWTFDAEKLYHDLSLSKKCGKASLPRYCREISDPVQDQIRLEERHKIILVEGNYLLLGSVLPEVDIEDSSLMKTVSEIGFPYTVKEEIGRWKDVSKLWDESWYIAPPGGFEKQRRRLIERSLKTWTPQKTETWGGGTDLEAATRRVEFNDMKNSKLVMCCHPYADKTIESI